ncbi:MAG: hypothetical protein JST19_01365 [Bacteroidetes bacterium]|nr:hypothetical protein [Bacteroidota bacterium]
MKFKTVTFNLDLTFADTLALCIAAFKKSIKSLLGSKLSEGEIVATFRPSGKDMHSTRFVKAINLAGMGSKLITREILSQQLYDQLYIDTQNALKLVEQAR